MQPAEKRPEPTLWPAQLSRAGRTFPVTLDSDATSTSSLVWMTSHPPRLPHARERYSPREVCGGQQGRDLQMLHVQRRHQWTAAQPLVPEPGPAESWQLVFRLPGAGPVGHSQQVRRGGFPSRAAATRTRDEVQALSREELAGQSWKVERWLRYWLSTRTALRPTTLRVYTQHVHDHLIPRLGQVRLAELSARQVTAAFTALATRPTPRRRHADRRDPAARARHPARGAERRHPRRPDHGQPGPPGRTGPRTPPTPGGVDSGTGRRLAATRHPGTGHGMDPRNN